MAPTGVAHVLAIVSFSVHMRRSFDPSCTRYALTKGAKVAQIFQILAAAQCAMTPFLELNGRLGQAATDPDSGPAPHEFAGKNVSSYYEDEDEIKDALMMICGSCLVCVLSLHAHLNLSLSFPAAGLACMSWSLLVALLVMEVQGHYRPSGRWAVRFSIVLNTSAEIAKLRLLLGVMEPGYFFYLYLVYVALQSFLALMALCWWPSAGQLDLVFDGYTVRLELHPYIL